MNNGAVWILLVEDDDSVSALIKSILIGGGFHVVVARDGEEGEQLFLKEQKFDLVLTDLGLPKIGGVELFHRLRTIQPNIKVIASSGYGHANVIEQLKRDGLNAFIPKPFKSNDLLEMVQEVLAE